jgi:hypothetical protein
MPATSPLIKRTLVQGPIHTPRPLDSRPVVLGRLVSLSSTFNGVKDYLSQTGDASSSVVINFPSMPETLDLGRRADYLQTTAPYTPDGIHLYKKTMPLEIPISFSLHSKDPFCSKGGLSLLIMAAKLHSLVLPMNRDASRSRISVTVGNYYGAASSVALERLPASQKILPRQEHQRARLRKALLSTVILAKPQRSFRPLVCLILFLWETETEHLESGVWATSLKWA